MIVIFIFLVDLSTCQRVYGSTCLLPCIGFNPKIGDAAIIAAAEKYSATVIRRNKNTVSVRLPKGSNVNRGINHFKNVRGVQTIDLEKVYRIQ